MTHARGVPPETLLLWRARRAAGGQARDLRCTAQQLGEDCLELRVWLGDEAVVSETFSSTQHLLRRSEELRRALVPAPAGRRAGHPQPIRPVVRH